MQSSADPLEPSEARIRALKTDLMIEPKPKFIQPLEEAAEEEPGRLKTVIFGPTCDGIDCLNLERPVPRIGFGDWLVWRDMGAYTLSAASTFNGMPLPKLFYFLHNATAEQKALTRRALQLEEPAAECA